jgi:hypothetical protein
VLCEQDLGDISTLANPEVVQQLIKNHAFNPPAST